MKKAIHTILAILAVLALGVAANVPAMRAAEKGAKPAVISHGAKVTLADNLVAGDITIFDFSSKYCPPCMALSPKLDALHTKIPNLAVVKVDINRPSVKGIDWKSPVAQQFKLHEIPHIKIYDGDGKLVAEDSLALEMVQNLIQFYSGAKLQQLLIIYDNNRPVWYLYTGANEGKQEAPPSTQNPPQFKNVAANEYIKSYSDYVNKFVAASKAKDADKISALASELQDWSDKAITISENLSNPSVKKRFLDWVAKLTSDINTAIAAVADDLKKGKNGTKGKGGKKGKARTDSTPTPPTDAANAEN